MGAITNSPEESILRNFNGGFNMGFLFFKVTFPVMAYLFFAMHSGADNGRIDKDVMQELRSMFIERKVGDLSSIDCTKLQDVCGTLENCFLHLLLLAEESDIGTYNPWDGKQNSIEVIFHLMIRSCPKLISPDYVFAHLGVVNTSTRVFIYMNVEADKFGITDNSFAKYVKTGNEINKGNLVEIEYVYFFSGRSFLPF